MSSTALRDAYESLNDSEKEYFWCEALNVLEYRDRSIDSYQGAQRQVAIHNLAGIFARNGHDIRDPGY